MHHVSAGNLTMNRRLLSALPILLAALTPLAHASLETGAHAFKEDVKTAGRKTGEAVGDAARAVGHGAKQAGVAVGHGAKQAGHAVADTARNGYEATKRFVVGDE
jgi:hypothetical protein